jgi:hypothetical protein
MSTFGDKINSLPVDENTPPTHIELLTPLFDPKDPSKFKDMNFNLRLGGIGVILFLLLTNPICYKYITKKTKNEKFTKLVVAAIIIGSLYLYHKLY